MSGSTRERGRLGHAGQGHVGQGHAGQGHAGLGLAALGLAVLGFVSSCAAHEEALEGPAPVVSTAPSPAIVQELEPVAAPPRIVAPPLPELAPSRALANLDLLWQRSEDATLGAAASAPPATIWAIGTSPVAMDSSDAASLGLGASFVDLSGLSQPWPQPVRHAGPLLVLELDSVFTALERGTKVPRWNTQMVPGGRHFATLVSPGALIVHYYVAGADQLLAWALADGRQLWRRYGEQDPDFSRIKALYDDGQRGYAQTDLGLVAFDLDTGATLWKADSAGTDCGVALGEGVVVLEDPAGHRVLDAASGKTLAPFPSLGATECAWEAYAWTGVAPGVLAQGRLFAFDTSGTGAGNPLCAFDLDTRRELWRSEGFDDDLLVVDHDLVLVARDEQVLVPLDAASGRAQQGLSIGAPFEASIEPVGGAAGPLVVVTDELAGVWILGRREVPPTPESYVIEGRLVATQGLPKRRLAGVELRVGEQVVKTDKRGRFTARGQARGALSLEQASEYGQPDPDEWTQVAVDPLRVVLTGAGRYALGDVPAYELSIE